MFPYCLYFAFSSFAQKSTLCSPPFIPRALSPSLPLPLRTCVLSTNYGVLSIFSPFRFCPFGLLTLGSTLVSFLWPSRVRPPSSLVS
ncbi:hypothetical protein BO85DRAFT_255760 [Aspergillus piperis CBS 112811]|uniref:Uncharacterized protein n=1 Tax=Aspergillus piperis CBS 112811 TaxID=1448313 RepID=A0A8G1RB19_9EURO|nr:hypothetical protein BO85DRAFT_255760 [Aspergillus piperis CBS 112811]RAH59980.1 hypothetical protein BO85DRAFT_255760 [Aspergillus piperis CBS 112811]